MCFDTLHALCCILVQIRGLEEEEQTLLRKEADARTKVQEATEKVAEQKIVRTAAVQAIKELQSRLAELHSDSSSLLKKLAGDEMIIERGRAQLHDVLRKAQMDEVALPTVETSAASTSEASSSSRGGRVSGDTSSSDTEPSGSDAGSGSGERLSIDYDKELEWRGSQSQTFGTSSRDSSTTNSGSGSGNGSGSRESSNGHFSQADNPVVARDSSKAARVDLSSMAKYKHWSQGRLVEKEREIEERIARLVGELEHITPNMHASERYEAVSGKLAECNAELEELKETARTYGFRFEDVKRLRQQLFSECYTHVCEALGVIYRDLTRSSKHPLGGNAYLTLDNTEEPYLSGTRFTAMPPMKRFRDMDQLSGGEKTMAALSMLFSIHSYRQAPFFVLDEVDAALDNVNVKKICNYIKHRSVDFQCIVITLKEMFFEHADCLVGICKDVEQLSSKILTLDLSQFADSSGAADGGAAGTSVGVRAPVAESGDDQLEVSGMSAGRASAAAQRRSATGGYSPPGAAGVGSGTPGSAGSGSSAGAAEAQSLGKRPRVSTTAGSRSRSAPAAIEEEQADEEGEE